MFARREYQRGSVLAEFTIVSLAALTIIFGIIDFGRAIYTYHLVSESARMATRYAIVRGATACAGGSPDPLLAYVRGQAPVAGTNGLIVTTSCADGPGCASGSPSWNSCTVTVKVDYHFQFLAPLVSKLTPTMSSTSTMTISQ